MRVVAGVFIMVCLGMHVGAADNAAPTNDPNVAKAGKDRTLIATVFGDPIYLDQVTSSDLEANRQKLPVAEFNEWLQSDRGRRIYQTIWGTVSRRYVEREQLAVTEAEMAAVAAAVAQRLKSETDPPIETTFTPEQRQGMMVAWGRASLIDWKICRSLHATYGGRVGIGSLGAWTAFDGQNALLREHYDAGEIKFHQAEMEEAFWLHTRIKNFADAYPQGERLQRLLAAPPYTR